MVDSIISIHMPKVAGTSFLHQLRELYGENQLLSDYNDDPVNPLSIVNIDPNFYDIKPTLTIAPHKFVHGHFHPQKYAHVKNAFRLTFLRHPIDNVISIYKFWMTQDRDQWDSPVFHYCKDAGLSLLRFAMLPKIRYLYTQTYFFHYDMENFDFIGDYAKYDEELVRLGKLLGKQFNLDIRLNVTSECFQPHLNSKSGLFDVTREEYGTLKEVLKDDINFYEKHKGK